MVVYVRVKVFDEGHERDLENKVNMFLTTIHDKKIVDIKFSVSNSIFGNEQIYCFSCMVVYEE